ncbi:MAG: single-stranded-DNA-specific exonuclease RecJ [Planctomycetales bacterium]|nr:single-stranded-DNA-specific exonuclease RecJ [Planctomycetales bacterium]MBN8628376.1 single-stranded-DNA-specific exonuclease RecJ [Planctomycetota bacterium]
MPKLWRIQSHDAAQIAALARSANVSPVVAQLLACRGLTGAETIREFLDAKLTALRDPALLGGVEQAAQVLMAAVRERRKITVYGDYDVDGMTATSLLMQCLKLLGGEVNFFVPRRLEEGYGLNADALKSLAAAGTKVVVTVDCGISAVAEAQVAAELGLELIITDHHEFAAELPQAAALVHPRLPGTAYPFAGLSGAGVAHKLAWELCRQADGAKKVSPRMRDYLMSALGLAALGTIADCVPLVDENRVLVKHGLKSLCEQPGIGIAALIRVAQLAEKKQLDCEDVGFALAPRLNAAGRLGQAELGVELLTTTNPERAQALAEYVNGLNGDRQSLERSIYITAHKQITEKFDADNDAAFVLADPEWHPGVIGIVAGRLTEKFHKPVILIALDRLGVKPGTGSARSVPGVELHRALAACTQHLVGHGGHAAAAGLKIDEHKVDDFRADFCEFVASERNRPTAGPELLIDAETPLSVLTLAAIEQIDQLGPFGQGNPRPTFCATGLTLDEAPKKIGGGQRHLSLKLSQHRNSIRAVSFGNADWAEELEKLDGPIDVAFRPVINEFRGRRTVEMQLLDWRASTTAPAREASPLPY